MNRAELTWLGEQAHSHSRIAEIGSYKGRSTRALADNTPGWVMAIDDWYGPRDLELPPEVRSSLRQQFDKNMAGAGNKLLTLTMDHRKRAILPSWFSFDMVFIDGDHSYEAVKQDIQTWLPLLEDGGLISGHDGQYESVKQAAHELLGDVHDGDMRMTIWWKTIRH